MATTSKVTDAPTEVEGTAAPQGENRSSTLAEDKRPPGDLRRRSGKNRRKGPFVKYVGAAALRVIDAHHWAQLNIDLKDPKASTTWSIGNDKMLEANLFSDAQLDYLLIDDLQPGLGAHSFLLVDYDENNQLVQAVYE